MHITDLGSASPLLQTFANKIRKPSLVLQVMAGMLLGILLGVLVPEVAVQIQPLATIFLRMIKMLIAPLLFATLVIGIAGTGGHQNFGRMGFKTILYFEIATTFALLIGLLVGNWLKPGAGMDLGLAAKNAGELGQIAQNAETVSHHSFWDTIVHMVPTSVIDAMAKGDILQLVVFSVFFALALAAAGDKGKPVLTALEGLSEVMFKFVGYVMAFAPVGVMAAMAATVGKNGIGVLLVFAKLVGALYFALILFVAGVLFVVCKLIRVPLLQLLRAIREPFVLAFSTASSEAALPKAMEMMTRFGVPKGIVSFVMPTGYSFNLDGSTLYLSLATLFVAQMAGVEMSIGQQILMMLTLMITSKGVAAVPRASLVILAGTLTAFGLPLEGIAVILGIDHVLDMGRTSVNLLGNCVATTVVARWEGALDDVKMAQFGTPDEQGLEEEMDEAAPAVFKTAPA